MTQKKRSFGWLIAGWIFLALAIVGIFLPIVPQVPFAIVAAFCFSRGSPRIHRWILGNRHLGPAVRDWELDRVVRPRLKAISIAALTVGGALAYWRFHETRPVLAAATPVAFALAAVFVATRRSKSRKTDDSRDAFRMPATEA